MPVSLFSHSDQSRQINEYILSDNLKNASFQWTVLTLFNKKNLFNPQIGSVTGLREEILLEESHHPCSFRQCDLLLDVRNSKNYILLWGYHCSSSPLFYNSVYNENFYLKCPLFLDQNVLVESLLTLGLSLY